MKKTSETTTTIVDTYHLTDDIKYLITFTNDEESSRRLIYTGENHFEYGLSPIYKNDISLLETTNPYWGVDDNYDWLKSDNLPDPEDIDLSKIILCQSARHSFFDINKKPIPVVVTGNYIEASLNDNYYDLKKLREYLLNHEKVVSVSEILRVPYYNAGDTSGNYYLNVLTLPTSELIQKNLETERTQLTHIVYGRPYMENDEDYLGIRKFLTNITV